jgi:putative tricarboxylic transport membrane protein
LRRLDRFLGVSLLGAGVGIFGAARRFTVGFLVDPVGPRALPYLVAGIFAVGGVSLLVRRGPGPEDSSAPTGPGASFASQGLCAGALLLYAVSIPMLGFLASTVLATSALSRIFGGRWLAGLGVGLALGLGLYGLFSYGFGLDLPPGSLFAGGP